MMSVRSLGGDQQGAAAIELAIVAPVFALLLIGAVQLSSAFSEKLQLEQAAQRIVEQWQGGGFDSTKLTAYKAEAAIAANVSASAVTIDYWLECNGARQSFTSTCTAGQNYARYANIDILKSYTPMFSTRWAGAQADGSYALHGKAGLRFQ
jgi:Flp pilus assembly protein TadG